MPFTTIVFGAGLIVLGAVGYYGSGRASITALIPAFFGLVFVILGAVARVPGARKHAMHAAAALGVLGFLGTVGGLLKLPTLLAGGVVARPAAVVSQSIMAILMAIFVGLAVKSFVDARRRRAQTP